MGVSQGEIFFSQGVVKSPTDRIALHWTDDRLTCQMMPTDLFVSGQVMPLWKDQNVLVRIKRGGYEFVARSGLADHAKVRHARSNQLLDFLLGHVMKFHTNAWMLLFKLPKEWWQE